MAIARRLLDGWHLASPPHDVSWMAGTGLAPSKRCQNVSVPDGACADAWFRTRRPHIASMSQTSVKPTFPDFRTFRTFRTHAHLSLILIIFILK